jgi:IMP dehydrogenase
VDILCIDSSDGFSEWQAETLRNLKNEYRDNVLVWAGNVVDKDAFLYLVEAGADFVKVGIGGGSICITREEKWIGRGQATALREIVETRDAYYKEKGIYIPICSDWGIVHDRHTTMALAMGADFLMMWRYFAQFDESPGRKIIVNGSPMKEYWGEGSERARNWQRYSEGDGAVSWLKFEEWVDAYIPAAGPMIETLTRTIAKIKSTMVSCGSTNLPDFTRDARITLVSAASLKEGWTGNVTVKT